jgi:arylsulfatase A-like enzyme
MKILKKIILFFAVVFFVACQNKKQQKPNVIYILADDLGYGDLGCYGQKIIYTPNLDRMAEEGMRFTQHYSGCTVSAPSRCSLLTGLHTGHSYIRGNKEILPEGQEPLPEGTYTLPQMMQEAGYTTACFGKWGLGFPTSTGEPNKQGFDEFWGYNCQRLSHRYYPYYIWHNTEKIILEGNEDSVSEPKVYAQDVIQEQTLRFIREHKNEPFFMYVSALLPHAELVSPKDSIYAMYDGILPESFVYQGVDSGLNYRISNYGSSLKPHTDFASMVTRLDAYVGQILEELRKNGLDKNTLVIFASDNGPHQEGGADPDFFNSYGPLKGCKRDVYEGGIRVPMIAWMPEKIAAGKTTDLVSAFWDIMPTMADLIGRDLPKTDGISLLPTLFAKGEQEQHEYLYWEFHELGGRQALRRGDWKIIRQPIKNAEKTSVELYNLADDIHEDENLSEKYPDKLKELEMLLDNARTESSLFNFGK